MPPTDEPDVSGNFSIRPTVHEGGPGRVNKPLYSPDGTPFISTDTDPRELHQWAWDLVRKGFLSAAHLETSVRFVRDANGMKNHLPIVQRLHLAVDQIEKANAVARQRGEGFLVELTDRIARGITPLCDELVPKRLEAFHQEQLVRLRAAKSAARQLRVATKALKELDRLTPYKLRPVAAAKYAQILSFWRDQRYLSDQGGNEQG